MTLELNINGYFDLTVCILGTEIPVENKVGQEVLDNLQQGEYLLGIRSRTILDTNFDPIYSVIIEATDSAEYEFEQIEE